MNKDNLIRSNGDINEQAETIGIESEYEVELDGKFITVRATSPQKAVKEAEKQLKKDKKELEAKK